MCASEAKPLQLLKIKIIMEDLSRTFTGFAQLLEKLTMESAEGPGYSPRKKGEYCKEEKSSSLLGNEATWISYIYPSKFYEIKIAKNY